MRKASTQKMGQNESKQRLHHITTVVGKIRKDIKAGKLTIEDKDKYRDILQRCSTDLENNLSKKLRAAEVYNVEQLIESAIKELNSTKVREDNLDLASVPTNSFSRGSSKKYSKDKKKSPKEITGIVEDIRQQIRSGALTKHDQDRLQRALAVQSQYLSSVAKKHKKKEIDEAQKFVSSVTTELFMKQTQDNVDSGSVRASTTPPPPKNEQPPRQQQMPNISNKNTTGTLDDIENKLEALKSDIKTAEANKDKNRLHFLSKSIQTLMTDLQLVNVKSQLINEERKGLLEKNLVQINQQISKIRKQITEDSDLEYLAQLHKKEKIEKCLQELDDIENTVLAISRNLNHQNYGTEKETFSSYKTKLNSIEEVSQEVSLKKAKVFDIVLNVENAFTKLEMEERLNQAERKHYQYRVDLSNFNDTPDSDLYKKSKKYLQQLRDHISQILEVSQKVDEKKRYVLYNIDNNLVALERKAFANEEKLKRQSGQEVIFRRNQTSSPTNQILVDDLVGCHKAFEKSFSTDCALRELKNYYKQINDIKMSLEQTLILWENYLQYDNSPQLVTIIETETESLNTSVPPLKTRVENVRKEVEALQSHIENSRYTTETQFFKDIKSKLEDHRAELMNLSREEGANGSISEDTIRYVDDVLLLLENNVSSRKSTTEDILIDIMSISTRVNDLGSKIQGYNYAVVDYDSIKQSLMEHQSYLRNLQISPSRTNLYKSRDEILRQIQGYLSNLENLEKNEDVNNTISSEEKKFNQELRRLKEKVSRYSGTYKNVLYKTIENDLNKCLSTVDKVFKDDNVAHKIKRDIENNKQILEQKSNKDQRYNNVKRDVRDSGTKELTEIRQNVESVKRELFSSKPLTKAELDKLDARLNLSILGLDNIKDDDSSEEKQILYQEIHLYFARIQELMVVSSSGPVISENLVQNQFNQQQLAATTLGTIQRKLEELKPKIDNFVGIETNPQFFELDEALVRSTLKIDGLEVDKSSDFYNEKLRLLVEIQKCSDLLEERVRQTEEMMILQKKVQEMLMKIDSFNGYYRDAEYNNLDEQIIELKVSLGNFDTNQRLAETKKECIRDIDNCMKKLNAAAKTRNDAIAGTLV